MKTFGRSKPSIAQELQFRRDLYNLIHEMKKETTSEIERYLGTSTTNDATPRSLQKILSQLRKKWYRLFDRRGKMLAKWLVGKTNDRTMKQIMRTLKKTGFTVEPQYTDAQKEVIQQITTESVNLIKSIPQQYLKNVQKVVSASFIRGQDMVSVTEYVKKLLPKIGEQAFNRAALIARDQTNKATQNTMIANAMALGATQARWIHVPGTYSSRITHKHMNGQIFNLADGLYDSDVMRSVKPGELIYCNCQMAIIMPGFE